MWTIQIPHLFTSSAQRGRIAILIPSQSQGKDYWKMMKECILHQRGWISQKLPSFGGVQPFYSSAIFPREWIRKSFQIQGRKAFVCRTILAKEECRCWDSRNFAPFCLFTQSFGTNKVKPLTSNHYHQSQVSPGLTMITFPQEIIERTPDISRLQTSHLFCQKIRAAKLVGPRLLENNN